MTGLVVRLGAGVVSVKRVSGLGCFGCPLHGDDDGMIVAWLGLRVGLGGWRSILFSVSMAGLMLTLLPCV